MAAKFAEASFSSICYLAFWCLALVRIRALAMACCGSLAVTLGSAAGPYSVSLAIEAWGWHTGYAVLVGVPLGLAGLLYLTLDALPSGLEVEEIENRVGKGAMLNG